ncbi:hypothetical protein GCM10022261_04680 [Brevibacterium daeguense]|uniref:DUF2254 domain-containing protein n=2 Tax=Brevibacterium daeguense TaxID=909936 RepID=A0ABP8EG26_9MICO
MLPALCVVAAAVLAQVMVAVDRVLPDDLSSPWISWIYTVGIDGSRSMLSSIGASMLGVAATAFSITISVIATTSSTYGPRLVRNFMADRGNQLVLGVLVSTFVYTLLVLRTIRSAEDPAAVFLPHLAVNFALVLAVADVAVVVYFIHHIASSVQVDTLVRGAQRRFGAVIERWHPREPVPTTEPRSGGGEVTADAVGYVVSVEFQRLSALTDEQDVVVELAPRVGDHVLASTVLAHVWPAGRAQVLTDRLRQCVRIADSRSADQDVRFAEQQLVELAVRALSPSTNDPYTAINAVEEVAEGIATAVSRPRPGNTIVEGGVPRVRYGTVGLEEIVDMPFDHIRPYAINHVPVLQALTDLAARIEIASIHPEITARARRHVEVLLEQLRASDPPPHDQHRIEQHVAARRTAVDDHERQMTDEG